MIHHPSSLRGSTQLRAVMGAIALALLAGALLITVAPVVAAPADVGWRDFTYGAALDEPTEDKPQSKVWWANGSWWGGLWNPTAGEHQIYQLVNHEWVETGVTLDDRSRSHADYLWDGTSLYVASASGDSQDEPILLFRYTWSGSAWVFDEAFREDHDGDPTLEAGIIVGQGRTESVTIAKDSTGQLWVTYTNSHPDSVTFPDSRIVMVNRSTSDTHTWGTPFALSTAPVITDDDISAIVSFGTSVGIMWTNQGDGAGSSFGFSLHLDGTVDDTAWSSAETAAADVDDNDFVDDHINLKATADGRVLAAVKTNAGPEHIQLLVRATNGTWSQNVVVGEGIDATRPQVVVDAENGEAVVLYTIPVLDTDTEPFADQQIFYKTAPLTDLDAFGAGNGTAFIADAGFDINNIAGSKQAATAASGLLAIAGSETDSTYYHGFLDVGGTTPTPTPTPSGTPAPTPTPTPTGTPAPTPTPTPTPTGTPAPTPTPTPTPDPDNPFNDVDESNKFYDDILWAYYEGITVGCPPYDRFCPEGLVTRAQMATFIVRALDLPPASKDYFVDDNDNIHEDRINSLAESGITVGCGAASERRFCPDGLVAREQMATFLVRGYNLPPTSTDYFIDDNDSKHEARINALRASGITSGCSADRFCPAGLVTRQQMAAFLHRASLL